MTTPLSYSMKGAVDATGLSKSYLDRAIRSGKLKAKRSGGTENDPAGNYVILAADLEAFLAGLVDA